MSKNQEIAETILQQLGGGRRLVMMVGAYNFVVVENGVAFKIKNAKANYIKIKLNSKDLYDLEVGRIRGTTYKVVTKKDDLYFDMLKPAIEQATGMYLSLFKKGGKVAKNAEKKYYVIVDENTDRIYIRNSDKSFIDKKYKELKEIYPEDKLAIVQFSDGKPYEYSKGGKVQAI